MIRFYLSGNEEHDRVITALFNGCTSPAQIVKGWGYKPSDIAVVFGVYKSKVPISWPRGEIFRQQREKKLDVIVLETGYINRGAGESHHYAAGFNGLNGRADFKNDGMPPDRVQKLGVELKPWRFGENVLLCGQVPWDASVEGTDHFQWLAWAAREIRRFSDRKIVFRPHPLAKIPPISGCEYSTRQLADDLKNAHCVVTYNSNSGVEALISGVPVIACDEGSMAWSIASRTLKEVKEPLIPFRDKWINNLCYAQWTPEEMREGLTWRHLSRSL